MVGDKIGITREIVHLLAKYSQWREESVRVSLMETNIRPRPEGWIHFLNFIFLALGGLLFVSGLFFFFAYNWAEMPKLVKLGVTEVPIVGLGVYVMFRRIDNLVGKILLTILSCLVGLAFAVYGQIYQTGATAFDFLLGWSLLTLVWVVISDFPPLWFLYLVLVNLTLFAFVDQFHRELEAIPVCFMFLGLNLLAVVLFEGLGFLRSELGGHGWLPQVVMTFVIGLLGFNVAFFILDNGFRDKEGAVLMQGVAMVVFAGGFFYYYHYKKEIAMVGLIPFAIICLGATAITKAIGDDSIIMFLVVGTFVVVCCGFLISFLTKYKRELKVES